MVSHQTVIVGYADEPFHPTDGTWYDTHVGGLPIFPPGLRVHVPPCPICAAPRLLVLQAYAPHNHHQNRIVYVFGCNNIKCSHEQNTWYAIRACQVRRTTNESLPPAKKESISTNKGDSPQHIDWDTDSGGESSDASDLADNLELLSLQVQLASAAERAATDNLTPNICKTPGNGVATSIVPKRRRHGDRRVPHVRESHESDESPANLYAPPNPMQAFYVHVMDEPKSPRPLVDNIDVERLLQKYRVEEHSLAIAGNTESWTAETDEELSDGRRHFEVFQERMQRAPGHILRYAFGGAPLWPRYPPPPKELSQICTGCGSRLVFELQILGSCLHYLQPERFVPEHQNEAGMNFAALTIFTCAADCTANNVLAESPCFRLFSQTVCVQHDDW